MNINIKSNNISVLEKKSQNSKNGEISKGTSNSQHKGTMDRTSSSHILYKIMNSARTNLKQVSILLYIQKTLVHKKSFLIKMQRSKTCRKFVVSNSVNLIFFTLKSCITTK